MVFVDAGTPEAPAADRRRLGTTFGRHERFDQTRTKILELHQEIGRYR
jgi:hypothetical protein